MTHPKLAHSHVHVVCKLNRTGKPVIPLNWSSMLHFINSCIHASCTCFQDGFHDVVRDHGPTHRERAGTEPWSKRCRASGIFESEV